MVKFLLEKGADKKAMDIDGKTPFMIAKERNIAELLPVLKSKSS